MGGADQGSGGFSRLECRGGKAGGRLPGGGEGGSPHLTLDGFSGPLDHLLTLARAQKIDLESSLERSHSRRWLISWLAALRQAPANMPLGQKGDWVVMAAWLVQLRARLLLPADAAGAAGRRGRGGSAPRPAGRLGRHPGVGRVVGAPAAARSRRVCPRPAGNFRRFGRGRPRRSTWSNSSGPAWRCSTTRPEADTTNVYRPRPFELYQVAEARDRILRRLAAIPEGAPLARLLPDPPEIAGK